MLDYYSPVFKGTVVYSIDMIRLQLDFSSKKRSLSFQNYILSLKGNIVEIFPPSYKAYRYRYLYKIHCLNDNVFIIGLHFNGSGKDSNYLGFIEFNPNKVAHEKEFQDIFSSLQKFCFCADIVRWDLAVDVPVRRDRCKLCLDDYDGVYRLHENSLLDYSQYLRERNKPGYVKLYNKQIESGLDYELTRLEVTVGKKMLYHDFCEICPEVIIKGDGNKHNFYDDIKSGSDLALLELLISIDDMEERMKLFNSLPRRKKEKFRQYINNIYGTTERFSVSEDIFIQLKLQLQEWVIGFEDSLVNDIKNS